MDNRLIKILIEIGLEPKQAKVYLALLELNEATVQTIAKKAALKRTTVYSILDELLIQELAFKTKSKKKTQYTPENPDEILKRLKNRLDKFNEHLGILNSLADKNDKKTRVLFLNNTEGFKKIWNVLFDSKIEEYLIITDPREMLNFVRKGYITEKIIKEKIKRNIKSRQLIAFSEYAKEIITKDKKENRISKILPHYHKIYFTTIIFDNLVALISPYAENNLLIIESDAFAETQRSLFEILWENLPTEKWSIKT